MVCVCVCSFALLFGGLVGAMVWDAVSGSKECITVLHHTGPQGRASRCEACCYTFAATFHPLALHTLSSYKDTNEMCFSPTQLSLVR